MKYLFQCQVPFNDTHLGLTKRKVSTIYIYLFNHRAQPPTKSLNLNGVYANTV